jgi:tetratricopeptide (TPR) repeat protein
MRFGEEGDEADFKKALEYKEKSFWLNPYELNNLVYAELLMLNKEFNKAIEVCNIVEKQDYSLMAKFRLGEIYYYLGDLDSSKAIFQQFNLTSLGIKIDSLFHLGMIHSQRGEGEKALEIIDDISLISPQEFVLYDYFRLASIYMGLGMKKSGYNSLESFFNKLISKKMRFVWLKYIDIERNFDRVREEEEFIRIAKK